MVNPDEKWLNAAGEVGGDRAIASPPTHTHTAFPWPHRTCWAHGGLFQGLGHPVGGDRRRVKVGKRVPLVGTHSPQNNFRGEQSGD